jgi:3',5'-cyclic AMP phosphodiesterase CpdA
MRIATVSDLHTDFEPNRAAVVKLAVEIHRRGADLVVIAGDVSPRDDRIARAIGAFLEVAPRVAFVPGNHDLWAEVPFASLVPELDTWRRYREDLRALVEREGAHYLPAEPLVLDGVGVAGSCGWYDYSLLAPWLVPSIDPETLASKTFGGATWSDARFVVFRDAAGAPMPDPEVARVMEAELAAQLAALEARDDVRAVVAVTHHQAFPEVVVRTGTLPWDFFNAYMGSAGLGAAMRAHPKVRHAVHGHTHAVTRHDLGGLVVHGTALGYPRERGAMSDEALVATRVGWIEL